MALLRTSLSRAFSKEFKAVSLRASSTAIPSNSNAAASADTDVELRAKLFNGRVSHHKLEKLTANPSDAVQLRREFLFKDKPHVLSNLPSNQFDVDAFYKSVLGTNCETVIGYVPLPVGIVGPLLMDGEEVLVPMATTEGALIASTNRGARAIYLAGGAKSVILKDGITRAPAINFPSLVDAAACKSWLEEDATFDLLSEAFSSTTRFGKLTSIKAHLAGRTLYVRFACTSGDAMGMNMIGKGSNAMVSSILEHFPEAKLLTLSGNMCIDKKPSAMNWIEGRGKSVAVECVIPANIVETTLKTTVDAIVQVNIAKNLVGSQLAGSIGGCNAHAANMVTAVFLATGQDPAQNVESSNCITLMEKTDNGDLRMSVTMPSVEVGTVGGGTSLPAQKACLSIMNLAGASNEKPGDNAKKLARLVGGTVLAGELSLIAALSVNHLVSAHMQLNRKHT